jgi:hypothetical protein
MIHKGDTEHRGGKFLGIPRTFKEKNRINGHLHLALPVHQQQVYRLYVSEAYSRAALVFLSSAVAGLFQSLSPLSTFF